jgi:hypothetical protein
VRDGADSRARLTERREGEATSSEGANEKGKRTPAETPSTHGLDGLARGGFGLQGQRGQRGWLGKRSSGPEGRPGRKQGKRISELKNWIFEFSKALEICRRRFRRNFDMGIFPRFF